MSDPTPQPTEPVEHKQDTHAVGREAAAPAKMTAIKAKIQGILAKLKKTKVEKEPSKTTESFKINMKEVIKSPVHLVKLPLLIITGDWTTKFLTLGFFAGLVLMISTGGRMIQNLIAQREKTPQIHVDSHLDKQKDFERLQKEFKAKLENLVFLEEFTAHLKSGKGNLRTVEIEIFVETSEPETAEWIKTHITPVREVALMVMQDNAFELLMSDAGKNKVKADVTASLNNFLKKKQHEEHFEGEVLRVWFTNLIVAE